MVKIAKKFTDHANPLLNFSRAYYLNKNSHIKKNFLAPLEFYFISNYLPFIIYSKLPTLLPRYRKYYEMQFRFIHFCKQINIIKKNLKCYLKVFLVV